MTDPDVPTLRGFIERTIAYERSMTDQRFVAERERSDATYASLVKLVEHRFDALVERLEQRHNMLQDNLLLKADENERRLTVLNHAHEAAVKEAARVLPREMFDQFKNEYEKFRSGQLPRETFEQFKADFDKFRREDYEKFRLDVSNQLQVIATRSITWTAAIGLLITIVTVAIRFLP